MCIYLYCELFVYVLQFVNGFGLLQFVVQMGNVWLVLGFVQYEVEFLLFVFFVEVQVGLGMGVVVLIVVVFFFIFMYRYKSKQVLWDYQKVLLQLESLEIGVGDQCCKEFIDFMMEMIDFSSDLEVSGIFFLDYCIYVECVFFFGYGGCLLQFKFEGLGEDGYCIIVYQGFMQFFNLFNSKFFFIKFIYMLESQCIFLVWDCVYVVFLFIVVLYGKFEYFIDIFCILFSDLVVQYVVKNFKLMLWRIEIVVEKLFINWMFICLYIFVRDFVGEFLYMFF